MKTMKIIYLTLILWCFAIFALAQSTSTLTPGYWTFGINGGWAYQSSDVSARLNGYGVGLTLGKNLYYRPGTPLAFDLRGRLLFTQQYGLDAQRTYDIENNTVVNGMGSLNYLRYPLELQENQGFIFSNHQTTTGELALEGLITLNSLRERTSVHVGLFGGIGLDWYKTKTDQADFAGNEYFEAYAQLKENQSNASIRNSLKTILNDNYESVADGNKNAGSLKFMPSLGVELGYQLTPKFLVYSGHRVTFSGTDLLDGQRFENANNDLYHYTNFGLRWTINPQKKETLARKPEIDVIAPFGSPYTTQNTVVSVIADIRQVHSAADVECLVNGYSMPFEYKNGRFEVNTNLNIGNNEVIIIAKNEAGQVRKNLMIVYRNVIIEEPVIKLPVIRMTNPPTNNYRTENADFTLQATIENIKNEQEISLKVNNFDHPFTFENGYFRSNIVLHEGVNIIEIRARNSGGIDAKATSIFYQKLEQPKLPPIVHIAAPASNSQPENAFITVFANIEHVSSRNDINLTLNGLSFYDFDYNLISKQLSARVELEVGHNMIVVQATNKDGTTEQTVNVRYNKQQMPLPSLQISTPTSNSETREAFTPLRARVENVSSKADIYIEVNEKRVYNFNYDINTQQLTARVSLQTGNNAIRIAAKNETGNAEDAVSIRYRRTQPPTITMTTPENGSIAKDNQATVKAQITNVSGSQDIVFKVNGVAVRAFELNGNYFSAVVTLKMGENNITLSARNNDGKAEAQVRVMHEVTLSRSLKPNVRFTQPAQPEMVIIESPYIVKASLLNVTSAQHIELWVNEVQRTDFDFSPRTRQLTVSLNGSAGRNTIRIKVRNEDGAAEAETSLIYKTEAAQEKPVINIISTSQPASNPFTLDAGMTILIAQFERIDSKDQIKIWLNDEVISDFSFDAVSKTVETNLNLKRGSNNLVIQATNASGSTELAKQIDY